MADATAKKIRLELVSPEKLLLAEDVTMVVMPGTDGQFGVLADHIPLVSTLEPGIIDVYQGSDVDHRIFVAGGFVEVDGERCVVLAEDAAPLDKLDAEEIRQKCRDLKEDVGMAETDAARLLATNKLTVSEAMLAAATGDVTPSY